MESVVKSYKVWRRVRKDIPFGSPRTESTHRLDREIAVSEAIDQFWERQEVEAQLRVDLDPMREGDRIQRVGEDEEWERVTNTKNLQKIELCEQIELPFAQ